MNRSKTRKLSKMPLTAMFIALGYASAWAGQHENGKVIQLRELDLSKMAMAAKSWLIARAPVVRIGGQEYKNALPVTAYSYIYIDLGGKAKKFESLVGVDDCIGDANATVKFRIFGDGRELFNSGIMARGDRAKHVDIDLEGVRQLVLTVLPRGESFGPHYAAWADAQFTVEDGATIKTILPEREKAEIRTPKAANTPRINGPKIYGARPGAPFAYTIPATGVRPMKFGVEGLPTGLAINVQNGQITGSIDKAGRYEMTLTAENSFGKAQRTFSIVVGQMLSLTPPMGWSSWYTYRMNIDDAKIRLTAKAMVDSGLIDYGYSYIGIDDGWTVQPSGDDPGVWDGISDVNALAKFVSRKKLRPKCSYTYVPNPRDCNGMLRADQQFGDMNALTDYIHGLGLKAGIYTSPGPLTCGGHEGSYLHEQEDAKRFAQWGFDFVKYDWCTCDTTTADAMTLAGLKRPFAVMGAALQAQKRDMIYNLCQYGMGGVWEWGTQVGGHLWRTDYDIGYKINDLTLYCSIMTLSPLQNRIAQWAGPGQWNDPDYLLLGHNAKGKVGISPNEQYTYMTLWTLWASPLFFSCDMARLDDFTMNILANSEVLAINQDSLGVQARMVYMDDDCQVWAKPLDDGSLAIGLLNTSEFKRKIAAKWDDLNIRGKHKIWDVWRQKDAGVFDGVFEQSLDRHDAGLYILKNE